MNLQSLISLITTHHSFTNLSETTKSQYLTYWNRLPSYLLNTDIYYLTISDFFHYIDSVPQNVTANRTKSAIQKLFSFGYQRGYCDKNLIVGITKRKEKPRTYYITDAEYMLVYAYAVRSLKCVMEISYLTVSRLSEVLNLKISDLKPNAIQIYSSKSDTFKNVQYSERLFKALEMAQNLYSGPNIRSHLICKSDGSCYSKRAIQEQYTKAKQKAGLTGFTFHDIRAKGFSDRNEDRVAKQISAGHKNINMGKVYDRKIPTIDPTR